MITLYLLHPVDKTPVQNWTFEQVPSVRIGRSADNDVVLYSAVVSRHHIELHRTVVGWHLKSIGTNGTYLNGKRISETSVSNGLVIRLARSGPIIQIHTNEEPTDPLKLILSKRSKGNPAASSPSEVSLDPTEMEQQQFRNLEDPSNGFDVSLIK